MDMFHFTGSPAVGQRIMERAAVGARKVVLELGGKSANIVCEDADLDAAIPMGVYYCMTCSGQGCTLATRMIVHPMSTTTFLAESKPWSPTCRGVTRWTR